MFHELFPLVSDFNHVSVCACGAIRSQRLHPRLRLMACEGALWASRRAASIAGETCIPELSRLRDSSAQSPPSRRISRLAACEKSTEPTRAAFVRQTTISRAARVGHHDQAGGPLGTLREMDSSSLDWTPLHASSLWLHDLLNATHRS
eukprot:6188892-Pleurochrysis_carterae.AAC.2